MKDYEKRVGDFDAVLAYFKELNRQGKYLTVIRLYMEKEVDYKTCHLSKSITEQFDYATENIEFLK